jgi:organic hydroperoxide reductase OsmC/OhrA
MQKLPHTYAVAASATSDSDISLTSQGLETIASAAPAEFGGPGNRWSPETLLTAAVADCFILSFKAIARASRFDWSQLSCDVQGTLDRVDGQLMFTEFSVSARLVTAPGCDVSKAEKLLHKAEAACLITNSLSARSQLHIEISHA